MARSSIIKAIITGDTDGLKEALTGADSALGRFRSSVTGADGVGGKFKAGFASVSESVQANAGALAVTGGAALVAFGVKALNAFEGVAKAARDLGTATGLAVEDASRWIAVADDVQVSSEALAAGFGKVAKSLDSGSWSEYGIATRDAGGAARDTNDILLDSFDMLGKIGNETERARVGNDLFGKGYKDLSPLIGKTRAEYEQMLGAVEKGQVVTQAEADKAKRVAQAQDALGDALQEVTLAVGGLVAEAAPLIESLAGIATKATEVVGQLGPLPGILIKTAEAASMLNPLGLPDVFKDIGKEVVGADVNLFEFAKTVGKVQIQAENVVKPIGNINSHLVDLGHNAQTAEQRTRDLDAAYKRLTGSLSAEQAWIEANIQIRQYNEELSAGTVSMEEARLASIGIEQALIAQLAAIKNLPGSYETAILTKIDEGKYEEVQAIFAELTKPKTIPVTVSLVGIPGQQALKDFTYAAVKQAVQPGGAKKNGENAGINIGVMNITDGRTIATELNTAAALYGR